MKNVSTNLKSLKKSFNNCKKGNWNNLTEQEIKRLVEYQREQYFMYEENMTPEESNEFKELFNKLVKMCNYKFFAQMKIIDALL